MNSRSLLLAALAASLVPLATAASAADIGNKKRYVPPAPYNPPVRDWSGAYVGAHGAFVGTGVNSKAANPNIPALNFKNPVAGAITTGKNRDRNTKSISGGGGGIQAGYNFQSGNIVYGAEAEATLTSGGKKNSTTNLTAEQTVRGAVKGKLGYSFGSTLVYATAGVAVAPTRYSSPAVAATLTTPATLAGKKSVTAVGPLIGIGVQQRLTDNLSLKGEVELSSFGKTKLVLPAGRTSVENSQVAAKVGLNYHF
jgi:outer membrane immunogenic protein